MALGVLSTLLLGCSTSSNITATMEKQTLTPVVAEKQPAVIVSLDSRPNDFHVRYDWCTGVMLNNYEYTITVEMDGHGQIVMRSGYASGQGPNWTETFLLKASELDSIYRLLLDKGLFTQKWQKTGDIPEGGSSNSMIITAHGKRIEIPAYVISVQQEPAADMASAVEALVSKNIWDKVNAQREQYFKKKAEENTDYVKVVVKNFQDKDLVAQIEDRLQETSHNNNYRLTIEEAASGKIYKIVFLLPWPKEEEARRPIKTCLQDYPVKVIEQNKHLLEIVPAD
jgi:hypothetical protein